MISRLVIFLTLLFTFSSIAWGQQVVLGARAFRFVQAVPGINVDVYLNGKLLVSNSSYATISNFTEILSTDTFANVLIVSSGVEANPNTSVAQRYFSAKNSGAYTIVYRLQFGQTPYLDLLPDSLCSIPRGSANSQIQFFNLDSTGNFAFVDFLTKGNYVFQELPSSLLSRLTLISSGSYNFTVTGSHLNGPVYNFRVNLLSGQRYIFALFGTFTSPSDLVFQRVLTN